MARRHRFYFDHEGIVWFEEAIDHYINGRYSAAAKLFLTNGYNYAHCCRGLQHNCPLYAAIRAEIASLN